MKYGKISIDWLDAEIAEMTKQKTLLASFSKESNEYDAYITALNSVKSKVIPEPVEEPPKPSGEPVNHYVKEAIKRIILPTGLDSVTVSVGNEEITITRPIRKVCPNKVDGSCPLHNLHCQYPKCEE